MSIHNLRFKADISKISHFRRKRFVYSPCTFQSIENVISIFRKSQGRLRPKLKTHRRLDVLYRASRWVYFIYYSDHLIQLSLETKTKIYRRLVEMLGVEMFYFFVFQEEESPMLMSDIMSDDMELIDISSVSSSYQTTTI